jgi:uncharacterized protein (TIGR02246 family)
MLRLSRLRLFGLILLAGACSQPAATPADTSADEAAIAAVLQRESMMLATGNVDSVLTVYTDDVKFLPPGEPMVDGAAAARSWAQAMFAQVTMSANYTSSSVIVSGDLAVDRYTATLTMTPRAGPAMNEQIKGIHVLRKGADGAWKIAQDTWNSDTPAAPPAPPTKP